MFLSLKRHLLVFNGCKYKAKYFFPPNYIAIFCKLASFFICFSAHIDKKLTVLQHKFRSRVPFSPRENRKIIKNH
jgi:hypothetical protein